jgi:hypothetical protein
VRGQVAGKGTGGGGGGSGAGQEEITCVGGWREREKEKGGRAQIH